MFGIMSIIALIVWWLCRIFKKNKINPDNNIINADDPQNFTTQSQPLNNYRKIPIPFTDADTKVPSAESFGKRTNQITPTPKA